MSKIEEKGEDTSPQDKRSDYWSISLPADAIVTRTSDRPIKEIPEDISPIWQDALLRLARFAESFSTIVPEDYIITKEELAELTEEQKEARFKLFMQLSTETDEAIQLNPARLFERQCEKEKLKDPYFNIMVFAEMESMRARAAFGKYQMTPELYDLYSQNPVYLMVRRYIGYLDDILSGKIPQSGNLILHSCYNEAGLERIFDNFVQVKVMKRSDKKAFVSMFTTGFIGRVSYNAKVSTSKAAAHYVMYHITGNMMSSGEIKKLLDFGDIEFTDHNRSWSNGKLSSLLGKKILSGIPVKGK